MLFQSLPAEYFQTNMMLWGNVCLCFEFKVSLIIKVKWRRDLIRRTGRMGDALMLSCGLDIVKSFRHKKMIFDEKFSHAMQMCGLYYELVVLYVARVIVLDVIKLGILNMGACWWRQTSLEVYPFFVWNSETYCVVVNENIRRPVFFAF